MAECWGLSIFSASDFGELSLWIQVLIDNVFLSWLDVICLVFP